MEMTDVLLQKVGLDIIFKSSTRKQGDNLSGMPSYSVMGKNYLKCHLYDMLCNSSDNAMHVTSEIDRKYYVAEIFFTETRTK